MIDGAAEAPGACGDDGERPEQPAQHVEVVNQHLADHQPRDAAEARLARERWDAAALVGEQTRRSHLHEARHRIADQPLVEPAANRAVVRAIIGRIETMPVNAVRRSDAQADYRAAEASVGRMLAMLDELRARLASWRRANRAPFDGGRSAKQETGRPAA
jgi:hypothetical protein